MSTSPDDIEAVLAEAREMISESESHLSRPLQGAGIPEYTGARRWRRSHENRRALVAEVERLRGVESALRAALEQAGEALQEVRSEIGAVRADVWRFAKETGLG